MHYVYEYQQFWIDGEAKAETLEAKKNGDTFPVSITIYDQYRND